MYRPIRALTAVTGDGAALPTWLSFDAVTRTLSGTPVNGDVGKLTVKITATDSGNLSVSHTFDLAVINTNDAPVAEDDIVAINENATTANVVPTLLANDTDVDVGDTRTITAVNTTQTSTSFSMPTWRTQIPRRSAVISRIATDSPARWLE